MLDSKVYIDRSGGFKALDDPNMPKTIGEWLLDLGEQGEVYAFIFEGNVYAKIDSGEPGWLKCYQVKDSGLVYFGRSDCDFADEVPRRLAEWFMA